MGFRYGSLSARRFAVKGEMPEHFTEVATNALRRYCFKPINDDRGERESFGWVNPRALLAQKFTAEDVTLGSVLFLGTRRDRKAYSPVLFRARLGELMRDTMRARKIEKITRQQRLALEEQLAIQMLKETSPSSAFHELVWDTARMEAYIGATSNALCDRITELFEATFDMRLMPKFPALIGADYIAEQGLEEEFRATAKMTPQQNAYRPAEEE